jgi:hypoxanthine phosphoribosyltransferase
MKPEKPIPLPHSYIPEHLHQEVQTLLIGEWQIAHRVNELAHRIEADFRGKDLVVVSLLNGAIMFLADLIRDISMPMHLDFIGVSSYGSGTESRELVYTKDLQLDVKGRDVLLVDDILDTGRTLKDVTGRLEKLAARSVKTCVLLDKPDRRSEEVQADYVGFEVPDFFVVGYGLDYAERYRNLPFIGVLKPEMYQDA